MEGKKRSKEGKGREGMDGWRFYAIGQQNCLQMALSFFDKDHIENLLCVRVPFLSSDDRNYQALGWWSDSDILLRSCPSNSSGLSCHWCHPKIIWDTLYSYWKARGRQTALKPHQVCGTLSQHIQKCDTDDWAMKMLSQEVYSGIHCNMTRVGILGVRVRENLLISSSTLPELRRSSGTATSNSRTSAPPFPSLIMTRHHKTLKLLLCWRIRKASTHHWGLISTLRNANKRQCGAASRANRNLAKFPEAVAAVGRSVGRSVGWLKASSLSSSSSCRLSATQHSTVIWVNDICILNQENESI